MKRFRLGFTIVEILVVVAILSLLTALLLPVFARGVDAAKQSKCLTNLKQIGLSYSLYSSDYDDLTPYAKDNLAWGYEGYEVGLTKMVWDDLPTFTEALFPYSKNLSIFHCPSDHVGTYDLPRSGASVFDVLGSSYTFRMYLPVSKSLSSLTSGTTLASDTAMQFHDRDKSGYFGNALYADGHGKFTSNSVGQ
jgi:prepilin-type N-terminal cleavage/methylation domain-containing protein/prepilin-type processing-associated H-X9-DG protein